MFVCVGRMTLGKKQKKKLMDFCNFIKKNIKRNYKALLPK